MPVSVRFIKRVLDICLLLRLVFISRYTSLVLSSLDFLSEQVILISVLKIQK